MYSDTDIMRAILVATYLLFVAFAAGAASVPQVEIQALDRAITRELGEAKLGSQTLGDLQRLKFRLEQLRDSGQSEALAELQPLDPGAPSPGDIPRLEREAADGARPALRSLALYRLYQNNPEEALKIWRRLGESSPNDLAHQILAAYIELALGEYNAAARHLESAVTLVGTRSGLELSKPIFCDNVAGYRLYVPRQEGGLLPGDNLLLYVEVDGADFHSLPGGEYECRLMFGLKLRNQSGVTLWAEPNYGEYAPVFNGPIRDLHAALTWRVPNDLVPGEYTLLVDAVEDSSKRRGETETTFFVAKRPTNPDPGLGGGRGGMDVNRALQDASKMFPGATPQFQPESYDVDSFKQTDDYRDLLRRRAQFGGTER